MVIRRCINVLLPIYFLLILLVSQPLAAQNENIAGELEVTLDFQNVELIDMIGTISELTGKNFVYDESVRGKVSIVSPKPVSVSEAYRLFSTVLRVKGFTIVPSGEVNKIISIRSAKEENLPIGSGKNLGEQFITRIIELKNLDAKVVVDTILRPLMPKTSHVVAYEPTNTVVITDSAANIKRLVEILTTLDKSWDSEQTEIVSLRFSDAEETAQMVMQILEGGTASTTRGAKPGTSLSRKTRGQVFPYERTNKLMLLGDGKFIMRAKELVIQLDEKADLGRAGVHVYYLEHAESEGLSETLNKIVVGAKKNQTANNDKSVGEIFGDVTITADKPTNALIVNATAEDYENVQGLIRQLDIKRKQVFVEALILELSMNALMDLGTSLQGAIETGSDSLIFGSSNADDGLVDGVPSVLTQAVDGILLGGLFNPITTIVNGEEVTVPALSALIGLSQTDSDVNVLSAPRLLTSDNEEAEIVVGKNVPIITSKSTDNAGNPINSVERQDAALTLRFTPQITEGNLVRLKIYQEISSVVAESTATGTVDEVGPTFKKTLLRNSIVARDGETVVLGGLFQTDTTASVTKVPLLGDIPFLGRLFKRTSDIENKTSLLIFITPKVIRDSEELKKITQENREKMELFKGEAGSEKFFGLDAQEENLIKPETAVGN
ncbi:type II secretion system secretin GspD [uncultured Desulfuromusa sp.]|uniref:type II secretion system secretin GspD n=1 Tax=uncultured Desulfuromusa sp. TaxID=219183 RepID=UPI002AA930D2|nr:type II secretion system secretin GspD [uncultured Desulfuromusa sp.]